MLLEKFQFEKGWEHLGSLALCHITFVAKTWLQNINIKGSRIPTSQRAAWNDCTRSLHLNVTKLYICARTYREVLTSVPNASTRQIAMNSHIKRWDAAFLGPYRMWIMAGSYLKMIKISLPVLGSLARLTDFMWPTRPCTTNKWDFFQTM